MDKVELSLEHNTFVNPITGRKCRLYQKAYKQMVKDGVLEIENDENNESSVKLWYHQPSQEEVSKNDDYKSENVEHMPKLTPEEQLAVIALNNPDVTTVHLKDWMESDGIMAFLDWMRDLDRERNVVKETITF